MSANSAVRFRDPFVISKRLTPPDSSTQNYSQPKPKYILSSPSANFPRTITPPPEMNGVQAPFGSSNYYSNTHNYGEYTSTQSLHRAPEAPYSHQEVSNLQLGLHGIASYPPHRPSSPRQPQIDVRSEPTAPRRTSQPDAIAAGFQIPRSVNNSGGSLAELAAQITCLFWFEPCAVLQRVEDSPSPIQPQKPLAPDAKPTTGFRKWVTTILSTTAVAQNVVILALLFIYRLKKFNPTVKGKPGSEYRLLTVALMLGNKFLDDNTYTNKTWAEVSGINVGEVHIMEVEFLSNMKYCLFTSEQDWARWQTLLGKFASFFDRASRPLPPAPVLPPTSSLQLPMALASPTTSNHASPRSIGDSPQGVMAYTTGVQHGATPAPLPGHLETGSTLSSQGTTRKRSLDDSGSEPPAKRAAFGHQNHVSPPRYPSISKTVGQSRLTLPSLSIPTSQTPLNLVPPSQPQQLPPLTVPARAMAMVFPNASSQGQVPQTTALAGPLSQSQMPHQIQFGSRHQSPYTGSATTSPSSALPRSATALQPPNQVSPSYLLQQRSSPYRPVHNVSTLLYPPPSAALQSRPHNLELNQMQYQPLGKPVHHTGRLPYVAQNLWLDGSQPHEMTPVQMWPGMSNIDADNHHTQRQP